MHNKFKLCTLLKLQLINYLFDEIIQANKTQDYLRDVK